MTRGGTLIYQAVNHMIEGADAQKYVDANS
jgi:hypothetical protein